MTAFQRVLEHIVQVVRVGKGRIRARLLAFRGAHIKAKVAIGPACRIDRPWAVSIGERSLFEDSVYLKIVADDAVLEFGSYVFVGHGSEFDVQGKVAVGNNSLIAPGCFITDHHHGISPDLRIDQQPGVVQPVTIGDDVWLGANVTVLAGVTIGDGAVVGANAVVTKDVPPMVIVAGVPATFLRYRDACSIRTMQREGAVTAIKQIAHR